MAPCHTRGFWLKEQTQNLPVSQFLRSREQTPINSFTKPELADMDSQREDSPRRRERRSKSGQFGTCRQGNNNRQKGNRARTIVIRRVHSNVFEFVFPRKVRVLADDLEEVHDMIAHEEWELAVDELLWLLRECHEFLEAHQLLGRIALFQNKLDLARAHLGYAYELGLNAMGKNFRGRLPFSQITNRPLLQATRDLVDCLLRLNERDLAVSIAHQLLKWDPSDPLHVQALCSEG